MNRRELLATGVGIGVLASAGRSAAEKKAGGAEKPAAASPRDAVIASTTECAQKGALCSAHCAQELAKGNTAMAHCAESVEEMRSLVQAMLVLVTRASPLAKKLAPLCAQACKTCADACLEHKAHWEHGMHLVCRDCMDSCLACEKACNAYAAA